MDYYNLFVEQAEYIDDNSFNKWNIEHPDEDAIIKKLSQGGAKLIIGPRGCGKTTLMRKTYYKLSSSRSSKTLPIYVNFKSSLKLEPLYVKNVNAVFWFKQWLLLKIYLGLFDTLDTIKNNPPPNLIFSRESTKKITNQLELGKIDLEEDKLLSISVLEDEINKVLKALNRKRCVLLLDDAAHAFSPEQQRDFFDFFRQIKSRYISPKAAIYPGVTTYSSTFHVGHDAEEIDVWIKPDSPKYIEFMLGLLEKRLPNEVYLKLLSEEHLLKLLCYAAFGIPRALLNLIRDSIKETADGSFIVDFKISQGLKSINKSYEQSMKIYTSLKVKLPLYEHFITTGDVIFTTIMDSLKEYNKNKQIDSQSVTIAIKQPLASEINKVIGFFQYCGLLLPKGEISKGEKGIFELYIVHYAALISRNVLFGKTRVNVSNYVEAFEKRNAHEYNRISSDKLIPSEEIREKFSLALPPCKTCNTPRISEHAKFCSNCGTALQSESIFESLVNKDISELPLTELRVDRIKAHSKIRTIKDILMDTENRELRSVPRIGPFWAERIASYAEEFIA
ncbi:MAG: zinc ribbon domain-containing protein [Methanosarcina sp.]